MDILPEDVKERFETKFLTKLDKTNSKGCWLYLGKLSAQGYGRIKSGDSLEGLHRFSYTYHKGAIPSGLLIRHTCDEHNCLNPEHLLVGTHQDNYNDMVVQGTQARGVTNGHAKLTEEQVKDIYLSLEPTKDLAIRYGVVQGVISQIRLNKNWTHVTDGLTRVGAIQDNLRSLSYKAVCSIYMELTSHKARKQAEIAKGYNTNVKTVSAIKVRSTYKELLDFLQDEIDITLKTRGHLYV